MPTTMETKTSTDSGGRRSGEAPARPPRPAHLTVPNLISSSLIKHGTTRRTPETTAEQERFVKTSGVAFNRMERATKFTYSAETGKWEMQSARFRIARESFAEGGMRRSYRAIELGTDGSVIPLVVKLFKDPKTKPAIVFHEALTQAVAEKYGQGFNNLCQRKGILLRINFLPVWVLHLTERSQLIDGTHHDRYATVEPFLPGTYIKLSDNSGRHLDDIPAQAAQTFSHYTFLASGRRLVCVDIQGVSELASPEEHGGVGYTAKTLNLTDPQIHSLDGNMFGAGNLGIGGINAFIGSYKRTMFDEELGLAHLGPAMMIETKKVNAVTILPAVTEAPPFDTAELASRLSEDERLARAEEDDEVRSLPMQHQPAAEEIHAKFDQVSIAPHSGQRTSSARERHSQRISDFATGGEVHRISMRARELTFSIGEFL
jgi:hypothetical protein